MAPRSLNDLYMKSPTGQHLGFLATFSNMRSTQLALGDQKRTITVHKIRNSERTWLRHMEALLEEIGATDITEKRPRLTQLAQDFRNRS